MSIKISCLTPSIRPAGLKITQECLAQQTFRDFEWLVEIGKVHEGHDLNKAYNKMLKRAQGELIVSLQDFIKVKPDYLQKFWDAYQKHPDTFFTAPVGKVKTLDYEGEVAWDWRAFRNNDTETIRDVRWDCWEIDSGAAPLKCLQAIGGFDEELDHHWSCDNLNVGCRADLAGYKVKCVFDNPAVAFDHDAFIEHPFRQNFRPIYNTMRMDEFRRGLKINYL